MTHEHPCSGRSRENTCSSRSRSLLATDRCPVATAMDPCFSRTVLYWSRRLKKGANRVSGPVSGGLVYARLFLQLEGWWWRRRRRWRAKRNAGSGRWYDDRWVVWMGGKVFPAGEWGRWRQRDGESLRLSWGLGR